MIDKKKRLGELLLEEGLIDRFQLQAALAEQKKWGGRLGKHLIELGILSEEILVKVLSKLLGLPSVDVGRLAIPESVIHYVPLKTVEKFNVIPIGIEDAPGGKKTIIVAMSDPTNLSALDELRFTTGCAVRAVVTGDSAIDRAIRTYYKGGAPQQGLQGRTRTNPSGGAGGSQPDQAEMVIMRAGVPEIVKMDVGASLDLEGPRPPSVRGNAPQPTLRGATPQNPPVNYGSLPPGALTPVPPAAADGGETEQGRRLNALLRVLVRRKLMTEEEFLAELAKG